MQYLPDVFLPTLFLYFSCAADLFLAQLVCKSWRHQVQQAQEGWKRVFEVEYGDSLYLTTCYNNIFYNGGKNWKEWFTIIGKHKKELFKSHSSKYCYNFQSQKSPSLLNRLLSIFTKHKDKEIFDNNNNNNNNQSNNIQIQFPPKTMSTRLKIILFGDVYVGKTSLIERLCSNQFNPERETGPGPLFLTKKLNHDVTNTPFTLDIWDFPGQQRYDSLIPLFIRDSQAIIILFSVVDWLSYERAEYYLSKFQKEWPDSNFILIASKCDKDKNHDFTQVLGEKLAEKYQAMFIQTSAKDCINTENLFQKIIDCCYLYYTLKNCTFK